METSRKFGVLRLLIASVPNRDKGPEPCLRLRFVQDEGQRCPDAPVAVSLGTGVVAPVAPEPVAPARRVAGIVFVLEGAVIGASSSARFPRLPSAGGLLATAREGS